MREAALSVATMASLQTNRSGQVHRRASYPYSRCSGQHTSQVHTSQIHTSQKHTSQATRSNACPAISRQRPHKVYPCSWKLFRNGVVYSHASQATWQQADARSEALLTITVLSGLQPVKGIKHSAVTRYGSFNAGQHHKGKK